MSALPLAILLMGPTACGKTELAVELAARFPCDIISVDSALVYRGMDIGTAKPDPRVLRRAPHRLIDICEPNESYSAGRFREDAGREMRSIAASGRIPLLVGGTMLYFRVLQQGLARLPRADSKVRTRLVAEARELGWAALHRRLMAVDPATACRIHPNDSQRIQRALEVFALTGRPLSRLTAAQGPSHFPYRVLKLIPGPRERSNLHRRIERRFLRMLEQGLEEEVRTLWARGNLTPEMPSMRCVGYRQVLQYLLGEYTHSQMVQRGIVATRQLAKRQLTWLRAQPDAHWIWDGEPALDLASRLVENACS